MNILVDFNCSELRIVKFHSKISSFFSHVFFSFLAFRYCSKRRNYNWYHHQIRAPHYLQLSGKVQVFFYLALSQCIIIIIIIIIIYSLEF